jgi:hypothetical protein
MVEARSIRQGLVGGIDTALEQRITKRTAEIVLQTAQEADGLSAEGAPRPGRTPTLRAIPFLFDEIQPRHARPTYNARRPPLDAGREEVNSTVIQASAIRLWEGVVLTIQRVLVF